jgi:hypothetical protein
MISQQALKEFKEIWKEEYGNDISDEFALEKAIDLLTFVDAIHHPVKKEWLNEHDNAIFKKNLKQ